MTFPLSSINGDVKWKGVQVNHARGWNISLKNDAKTYATNKTKGKVGRRPGNIDCTGSFTIYTTDGNIPMLAGQIGKLELFNDATNKWEINNAIILDTPLEVNIEDGSIEGVTINWGFAGLDDATNGSIKAPDGTLLDSSIVGP